MYEEVNLNYKSCNHCNHIEPEHAREHRARARASIEGSNGEPSRARASMEARITSRAELELSPKARNRAFVEPSRARA